MAERSVVVKLRAEIADFKRQMDQAAKATESVGTKAKQSSDNATTGLGRMVQSATQHEKAWTQAGGALTALGGAAALGVGAAISEFADFDAQMSAVQAATHETAAGMASLRQEAIDAGASTKFSATEAAQGIEELSKAGVETEDILRGGLDGALALAAAGSLEVGDAAEIAASAMTQFGKTGKDVPHIADLLAAAAGKAQGSVGDMGAALNQAGLVAAATGLSIEETTAGLAAFASAGLIGSDAGTSFKSMLQRLTPQSAEAAGEMDRLGISAYDAQGNFIGLEAFAGNLETAMADMSDEARNAAMNVIFGSDAVRAANVLFEQGADGIASWTEKVNDSGYAAQTAALMTNNLQGDLERLGGSFDTALIQSGSAGNGVLRDLVQTATGAVDAFNQLPQGLQSTTLGLGAIVAAAGLAGGGFLLLAPRIIETRNAVKQLKTDMPGLSKGLNGLAAAGSAAVGIAATAAAVSSLVEALTAGDAAMGDNALARALQNLADNGGFAASALDEQFSNFGTVLGMSVVEVNSLDEAIASMASRSKDVDGSAFLGVAGLKGFDGITDSMSALLGKLPGVTSYTEKLDERFAGLDAGLSRMVAGGSLEQARAAFDNISARLQEQGMTVEEVAALFPEYSDALVGAEDAQAKSAEATATTTEAIVDQVSALEDLIAAQSEAAGIVLSEREAQRQLEEAYDGVTDSIQAQIDDLAQQYEAQGLGTDAAKARAEAEVAVSDKLDISTEAGRRNQSALDDIAGSTWDLIESMQQNGATQEELQGVMATSRERFKAAAEALGLGADEADALADNLGLIPANVDVAVKVNTGDAFDKLSGLRTIYDALHDKTVTIAVNDRVAVAAAAKTGTVVATRATGGPVFGPGSETSDSIDARLSNNEHILSAVEVKGLGGHASVARLRAAARSGSLRNPVMRFAEGGSPGWAGTVAAAPAMSMEGMRIVGTLTIDGLPAVIDARVSQGLSAVAADASGRRRSGGWR